MFTSNVFWIDTGEFEFQNGRAPHPFKILNILQCNINE